MDENNNKQASGDEETEEINIPPVKNFDPKLFVVTVVLILVIVGIVVTILDKIKTEEPTLEMVPPVALEVGDTVAEPLPEKVNTGEALPDGFPKELILEEGVTFNEGSTMSYTKEDQMQLTTTFVSNKTVTENFAAYEKFFTERYWIITNKHETSSLAAIYSMKIDEEVNVTMEDTGTTTQITITLLKI